MNSGIRNTDTLKRFTLSLSLETLSDLDFLTKELEAASYAETMRRMLKLVVLFFKRKKDGAKILIQESDGTVKEILF